MDLFYLLWALQVWGGEVWDKWRGTDLSAVIPENPKGLSGTQW